MSLLEPPNPRSSDWGRLTIDSLIRDALRRAGVYERASKAGWPIGIRFADREFSITEVTVTAGCAPDQIVLGTAIRPANESFRPALVALIDQVIGQLNLLL
jgi:hypothetical protein